MTVTLQCSSTPLEHSNRKTANEVLLDSCVWVYIMKGLVPSKVLGILRNPLITVIVEENIVTEVARVLQTSTSSVKERMMETQFQIRYHTATQVDKNVSWDLVELHNVSHFPDSLYLATCKANNWVLVTCDRDLLNCCQLESVRGCLPSNLKIQGVETA